MMRRRRREEEDPYLHQDTRMKSVRAQGEAPGEVTSWRRDCGISYPVSRCQMSPTQKTLLWPSGTKQEVFLPGGEWMEEAPERERGK